MEGSSSSVALTGEPAASSASVGLPGAGETLGRALGFHCLEFVQRYIKPH